LKDAEQFSADLESQHFTLSRNPVQAGLGDRARSRVRHDVARLTVLRKMGLAESMGPNTSSVLGKSDPIGLG
jgi:hypothetical protein